MTDLCRKYYVDSINGNDTNDGLSETVHSQVFLPSIGLH